MKDIISIDIRMLLSVILIIILIHAFVNMNRRKSTSKVFMCIISLIILVLVLEMIDTILNNSNLKQFIMIHWVVNILGFMIAPCIPFLGYILVKGWINRYNNEETKTSWLLGIPLAMNAIATLMGIFGYGSFYITSQNIYHRGPLLFVLPSICYFYFGYSLLYIFKNYKKFVLSEQIIFSLFYVVPAIFISIQLRYPVYLTTWSSAAIVIIITYIFILNDQAYCDSLTGLGNRLFYERYTQNLNRKNLRQLYLVFIDIDKFKSINDQYGHKEGDEAIKIFAHLLLQSFPLRKKRIVRLGGDEFLVMIQENNKHKAEEYVCNLTNRLMEYNNREEKPYKLTFSYGLSRYLKDYENVCQLLENADQLMYEQKQRRKKSYLVDNQ